MIRDAIEARGWRLGGIELCVGRSADYLAVPTRVVGQWIRGGDSATVWAAENDGYFLRLFTASFSCLPAVNLTVFVAGILINSLL